MSRYKKRARPRQSSIPEEYLKDLADELTTKFMGYGEILDYIKIRCNKRYEVENILSSLEARGYLVAMEVRRVPYGKQNFYSIMNEEKYKKIEEDHRENAKRRLLAAVSY